MATYDLEEQEQIDSLKHFWTDYGRLIITGVVAFVVGVGGIQGWKYYNRTQAKDASVEFGKLDVAMAKGDINEIRNVGSDIVDRYPRTSYAPMAALVVAKAERDAGDLDAAASQLEWAAQNAASEEARMLSRLRLAGVLLDQEKYEEALKLLDEKVTEAFVALYSDLRGDVLVEQGKMAEARAAYQQALDKSVESGGWRNVVQIKIDALGTQ
jgi:predicted negative regulator of RcsB-dependent stress response